MFKVTTYLPITTQTRAVARCRVGLRIRPPIHNMTMKIWAWIYLIKPQMLSTKHWPILSTVV